MKVILQSLRLFGLSIFAVSTAAGGNAMGQIAHVVTPPSLEGSEGVASVTPASGPYRVQWLFPASDFEALPESHRQIVAWNWRGDASQTQALNWAFSNVSMWMSTTSTTSLTSDFDANVGSEKTLVHDGPFSFSILGTGPAAGPREIAAGIRLDTPFEYHPSQGNLLIEWLSLEPSLSPSPLLDLQPTRGSIRTIVGDPGSATAATLFDGAGVAQFEFVPEPSTGALISLALMTLAVRRRSLSSRPLEKSLIHNTIDNISHQGVSSSSKCVGRLPNLAGSQNAH